MPISPHSPRRQRRMLYTAHTAQRRKRMTVPLSKDLRARFHRRSLPVRKGDTVRILHGSFEGREERVAAVDRRRLSVTLDNVTLKTGESKQTALPVRTAGLVIVRLNLADPWRRRLLRVTEAELTPEERGEPSAPPESPAAPAEPGASSPPAAASAAPAKEEDDDTLEDLLADDDDTEEEDEEDDEPSPSSDRPTARPRGGKKKA